MTEKVQELRAMRDRVEERRKEVEPPDSGGGPPVFDSAFVLECLHANFEGDGLLFTAIHKGKFLYCHTTGEWLTWGGHCWRPDEYHQAEAAVKQVCLVYAEEIRRQGERLAELAAKGDEEAKEQAAAIERRIGHLRKKIYRLQEPTGKQNCLKEAANNREHMAVLLSDLDNDPWLLACPNGVIDLRTGRLRPGQSSDLISKCCSVPFDSLADVEVWLKFLDEVYEGDQEKIRFVLRLYGYGLTGLVNEHVFPVHQGRGRNAKGTLVEKVATVMGDYAGAVPAEMLLDSSRGGGAGSATPEIMLLKGLRLAYASETDENRRFSAAKVKFLTGGDTLVGRNNYDKKLTTFRPTHLLVLLTNPMPDAPPTDFAFWARALIIKHRLSFVKPEKFTGGDLQRLADPDLEKKLHAHLPGLLRLLVEGCLEWQKIGLAPPPSVTGETSKYQEQMNVVGRFVDCCCKIGSVALEVSAEDLYAAWEVWFQASEGNKIPSQKWFGSQFRRLELFADFKRDGKVWYRGLELNPEYADKAAKLLSAR